MFRGPCLTLLALGLFSIDRFVTTRPSTQGTPQNIGNSHQTPGVRI